MTWRDYVRNEAFGPMIHGGYYRINDQTISVQAKQSTAVWVTPGWESPALYGKFAVFRCVIVGLTWLKRNDEQHYAACCKEILLGSVKVQEFTLSWLHN